MKNRQSKKLYIRGHKTLARGASLVVICVFLSAVSVRAGYAKEAAEALPTRGDGQGQVTLITISRGIEMVLEANRLIKIALADKEMSFQDSMMARSALLPHINATASQTFNRFQPAAKFGSQNVNTADRQYFSFGFDVYQTLFDFGKSLSNYKASKELSKARKANIENVKRLEVLEFIVAYFDLLESEKMIVVAEKEVESLTSYLRDIGQLYKQGSVVKNDLLPAQVKLADAKQKLIVARSARELAASRLNNILGLALRKKIAAKDIAMKPPEFPEIEDAWKIAEARRPEIMFFEDQIRASGYSVKAKAAENLPTIFADGGYSYAQNSYVVHQDNAFVKLGAKVNLYEGGSARADLLRERARQKQLQEQKLKLIEDIKFEIEDSHYGLKDACEKVLVAKEAVAQAEENVRVNRIKYAEGSTTPTDVLEAITLETIAQTNYYSSDYELKRSYAKLTYSMGIDLALMYEMMERRQNGPSK